MNKALERAIEDTIERAKNGLSVYDMGAMDPNQMITVSNAFGSHMDHDHFVEGLCKEIRNGGNPTQWIKGYISVMFALGFQAGSRHETLNRMEK